MSFDRMPDDILTRIFGLFSRRETSRFSTISKKFLKNVRFRTLQSAGAANYVDFVKRTRRLHPQLRSLVLDDNYHLTLVENENLSRILALSHWERLLALKNLFPIIAAKDPEIDLFDVRKLTSDEVIRALYEDLITPEQAVNSKCLKIVTSPNGFAALLSGLITSQHLATIPNHVEVLLTDIAWDALTDGLITADEAAAMPTARHLSVLFQNQATLQLLREKLITPAQAAAMPSSFHLDMLITVDRCVEGLRKKRITPEQAAKVQTWYLVPKILDEAPVTEPELEPSKRPRL